MDCYLVLTANSQISFRHYSRPLASTHAILVRYLWWYSHFWSRFIISKVPERHFLHISIRPQLNVPQVKLINCSKLT